MNLLGGGSVYDVIKQRQKQHNCDNGVFEEVEIATILLEEKRFFRFLNCNYLKFKKYIFSFFGSFFYLIIF